MKTGLINRFFRKYRPVRTLARAAALSLVVSGCSNPKNPTIPMEYVKEMKTLSQYLIRNYCRFEPDEAQIDRYLAKITTETMITDIQVFIAEEETRLPVWQKGLHRIFGTIEIDRALLPQPGFCLELQKTQHVPEFPPPVSSEPKVEPAPSVSVAPPEPSALSSAINPGAGSPPVKPKPDNSQPDAEAEVIDPEAWKAYPGNPEEPIDTTDLPEYGAEKR